MDRQNFRLVRDNKTDKILIQENKLIDGFSQPIFSWEFMCREVKIKKLGFIPWTKKVPLHFINLEKAQVYIDNLIKKDKDTQRYTIIK